MTAVIIMDVVVMLALCATTVIAFALWLAAEKKLAKHGESKWFVKKQKKD